MAQLWGLIDSSRSIWGGLPFLKGGWRKRLELARWSDAINRATQWIWQRRSESARAAGSELRSKHQEVVSLSLLSCSTLAPRYFISRFFRESSIGPRLWSENREEAMFVVSWWWIPQGACHSSFDVQQREANTHTHTQPETNRHTTGKWWRNGTDPMLNRWINVSRFCLPKSTLWARSSCQRSKCD